MFIQFFNIDKRGGIVLANTEENTSDTVFSETSSRSPILFSVSNLGLTEESVASAGGTSAMVVSSTAFSGFSDKDGTGFIFTHVASFPSSQ